jgi:hypothetical protein
MARFHWLEAMLPLGIIGGFLCIMGNAQYYIHRAAHGRVLPLPFPLSISRPIQISLVLRRALVPCGFFDAAEAHRE